MGTSRSSAPLLPLIPASFHRLVAKSGEVIGDDDKNLLRMRMTIRELSMCVKKEINPTCCGILIHRRYGSVVGRVACRDMCTAAPQEWEFRHSGGKTGGMKTYLSPGSAFYFQIRRGMVRLKQGSGTRHSRCCIRPSLAGGSLWVGDGVSPPIIPSA
jgi:hypothetical protein